MSKPTTIVRDVSVYLTDTGEFLVDRADGSMSIALTSADVLSAIKTDDAKIAKRKRAMVVTRVTWYPCFVSTPAGGK
jgi:hypothetical protein